MDTVIELAELQDGRFLEDLQSKFQEALAEMYTYQAKVVVVAEFVLQPKVIGPDQSAAVNVGARVVIKHHKVEPAATNLYIHKGAEGPKARRTHPEQRGLFEGKQPAPLRRITE